MSGTDSEILLDSLTDARQGNGETGRERSKVRTYDRRDKKDLLWSVGGGRTGNENNECDGPYEKEVYVRTERGRGRLSSTVDLLPKGRMGYMSPWKILKLKKPRNKKRCQE